MLSFALFLMVLIHGVQSGTDTNNPWVAALYWGSGLSVLLGSLYRIVAARSGRSKSAPSARKVVALAGRVQRPPASEV